MRSIRRLTMLGPIAVALAGLAGCGGGEADMTTARASAPVAALAVAQRPAERAPVPGSASGAGSATGASLRGELDTLNLRLARLAAEVAQLKQQLGGAGRASNGAAAGASSADAAQAAALGRRDDPTLRAEDDRAWQQAGAEREAAFRAEPADARWAASMQSLLQQALAGDAEATPPVLRSIECRSRSCRVEITSAAGEEPSAFLPLFANRVAGHLGAMSAVRVDLGHGSVATVLYLSS